MSPKQPIRFTNPDSNYIIDICGLNVLRSIVRGNTSTKENTDELNEIPLEQSKSPESQTSTSSQNNTSSPESQSIDKPGIKPKKHRIKCNRPKNLSLRYEDSEWQCAPCHRAFRNRGGLLQHNNTHHSGNKPYKCDACGKRYDDEKNMLQHRSRHTATEKRYTCSFCSKRYMHVYDLKRHVDLHHNGKSYDCNTCGKAFDRADHLNDHMASHERGTTKRLERKKHTRKQHVDCSTDSAPSVLAGPV